MGPLKRIFHPCNILRNYRCNGLKMCPHMALPTDGKISRYTSVFLNHLILHVIVRLFRSGVISISNLIPNRINQPSNRRPCFSVVERLNCHSVFAFNFHDFVVLKLAPGRGIEADVFCLDQVEARVMDRGFCRCRGDLFLRGRPPSFPLRRQAAAFFRDF